MRFALVFALILAVLTVVFALQNDDPMAVDFLFVQTQGSKALVLIVTFATGVLTGLLSTLPGRIRDRRKIKNLKGSTTPTPGPSAFESPSAETFSRKKKKQKDTKDTSSSPSSSSSSS
ncbi:hypothetical protein CRI94_01480 [Longibacter salinarum]|uniref:Lipopolysaccharide assembly protein A domain-containing protein n=1 Tax=Longibacter salinarum TaxID=1850348 RepID=A0A2A8D275_9BACT|nr:LapA family protein [Longibacter salinarum]PEN14990.1 hypothetical protein CRI94_01480 [Longibacter salinarum]